MKKFRTIGIILCLIMLLCAFVSCGGNDGGDGGDVTDDPTGKTFTITYEPNGAVLYTYTKSVTYGEDYTLVVPEKIGYTFLGWYEGDTKYEGGKWTTERDVTLSAKWGANTYQITYNSNGGSVVDTASVVFGEEFTLATTVRDGYTFLGWYDANEKYESGVWEQMFDTTLKAKWEANTYTITYDVNGGEAIESETVRYNDSYTLPIPRRYGYIFRGWYDGATKFESGSWKTTQNVTLKAEWKQSLKILFIGNSATYTHDIPGTVGRLAQKAGFNVEINSVTLSGGKLSQHADTSTDHGKKVLSEINNGYDIVFIQEVTTCITSSANKTAALEAAKILDAAIEATGAQTAIYVRPPTGRNTGSFNSYEQCLELDKLFCDIAAEIGADNVYVNRACAYVIDCGIDVNLWGSDNAHLSAEGAYLASCVFFASIFNTSATVLHNDGISADLAFTLQRVADAVVFGGYIPQ